MVLLMEGLDNCGKSTQIQKLQTLLSKKDKPAHVLKYSDIKNIPNNIAENVNTKYYDEMFYLFSFFIDKDIDLICDRAHLGEMVYSPIYRNYDGSFIYDIEKYWKHYYKKFSAWNKIYLITIIDDAENVIKREDNKSLSGKNIELKNEEIERFKLAHELSLINNKLLLNISGKNIEQCHNEIIEFLKINKIKKEIV